MARILYVPRLVGASGVVSVPKSWLAPVKVEAVALILTRICCPSAKVTAVVGSPAADQVVPLSVEYSIVVRVLVRVPPTTFKAADGADGAEAMVPIVSVAEGKALAVALVLTSTAPAAKVTSVAAVDQSPPKILYS